MVDRPGGAPRWGARFFDSLAAPLVFFVLVGPALWSATRSRPRAASTFWSIVGTGMGVLFGLLWLAPHKANGDVPQAVGTSLALLGCSLFVMSVISVRWFRRAEGAFIQRRPVPPAAFPAFQALAEAEGRLAAATHRADRALAGWTEAEREEPVLLQRGDGLRTFDVWSTRGTQFHRSVTGAIAQEVAVKRRQLDQALRGCFRA